MSENIVIVGCSEIREGKLEELKAAMNNLVELVKAKEPQIIAYNVYLNKNGTQLTVLQVHPIPHRRSIAHGGDGVRFS